MFPGPSCPATGFFVCASPAPSSWGLSFSCPFFPGLIFRLSGMACRTAAGPCFPVCGGLLSFAPPSVPDAESLCFPYILHSYQSFLFHGPGRESPAAAQRRGPAIPTGAKFFRGWRGYGGGRGSFYKKRPFPSRHSPAPQPLHNKKKRGSHLHPLLPENKGTIMCYFFSPLCLRLWPCCMK